MDVGMTMVFASYGAQGAIDRQGTSRSVVKREGTLPVATRTTKAPIETTRLLTTVVTPHGLREIPNVGTRLGTREI
jgi:hypothetical protein